MTRDASINRPRLNRLLERTLTPVPGRRRYAFLLSFLPPHCGPEQPKSQTEVLDHSLVHLLVHLHHSLVCLLRSACFARVLRCAHSFTHFALSLACGTVNNQMAILTLFFQSRARDSTSHFVGLSVGRSVPLCFFWVFRLFTGREAHI